MAAMPTSRATSVVASGCPAPTGGGEQITPTVATFNESGYDDLLAEYNTLNPNVKAVEKKAATSDEARENFMTKLAAGSGLSDIEGVEVDWLPEVMGFVPCTACGELTARAYLRILGDKQVCIPCSGYER